MTTIEAHPDRILKLFRVPDPDPSGAIEWLSRQEALNGVTYEAVNRGDGEVWVTVCGAADDAWEKVVDVFGKRHGRQFFSFDDRTVDDLVAERMAGHRVVTAESCTGGGIVKRLTDRPGSSAYVVAGLCTCWIAAKEALLGVPVGLISRYNVISARTAEAMAKGALALELPAPHGPPLLPDIAIAVTGLAGPDGGTEQVPVGTVFICAMTSQGVTHTYRVHLPGDRAEVRERAVTLGMHLLRVAYGPERLDVHRPIET